MASVKDFLLGLCGLIISILSSIGLSYFVPKLKKLKEQQDELNDDSKKERKNVEILQYVSTGGLIFGVLVILIAYFKREQ
jgi:hypothetical protein